MKFNLQWILDLKVKPGKVVEKRRGFTGPRGIQSVCRKHDSRTELTDWTLSTVRDGDIAQWKRACQQDARPRVLFPVLTKSKIR